MEKRSTIEIRFIFCTKFVMCITLSDTKAVFMRVKGMERNIVIKNEHIYLKKESD